jgi:Flp pilus assembly protein CpaB
MAAMKNKNLALMGVAIACGLVAAFVTAQLGAKSVAPQNTVKIPVAVRELAQGTKISSPETFFQMKDVPVDLAPPDAIIDLNTIKGKTLAKTIKVNSAAQPRDFTNAGSVDLPEGKQAFGLRVSPEIMAGGLIIPGTHVDVLWIQKIKYRDPRDNMRERDSMISKVLLQNMLVVAVDAGTNRPEDKNTIANPSVVSLAVNSREAQMLALAARTGELTLTLRQQGDETKATDINIKEAAELLLPLQDRMIESEPATQIPVAIKDIPANTRIENFSDWFQMQSVNPRPVTAAGSIDELVGRVVTRPVFAEQFVPRTILADEPLEDEKPPVVVVQEAKPEAKTFKDHLLTIQTGMQKPVTVIYRNGRAMTSEDAVSPFAPGEQAPPPAGNR